MKMYLLFFVIISSLKADWEIIYFSDIVKDPSAGPTFQSIVMDGNNRIWIGFQKGLLKYENEIWTKFDESNTPIKYSLMRKLKIDNNGNLWAITGFDNEYSSIIKYNEGDWLIYNKFNSLYDDYTTNDIAIVSNNEYWLATLFGIYNIFGSNVFKYLENDEFFSINKNSKNELFVGSKGDFYKANLNESNIIFEPVSSKYNIRNTQVFHIDKLDRLWFPHVRSRDGIILNDKDNWFMFDSTYFDNDKLKASLFISQDNEIFVSNNLGIYKFESNNWIKVFNFSEDLSDFLKSIIPQNQHLGGVFGKDSNGNFWLTGSYFLIRFTPDQSSVVQKSNITLYPNPSQASITVSAEQPITSLSLYSLNLSKIKDLSPNHTTTQEIDISNLASGVYFIKINNEMLKFVRE